MEPLGCLGYHDVSELLGVLVVQVSVLKNVLSGWFNVRDDFWVVQVAKKLSQLVFVPSMAIFQDDRIAVFGVWDRQSFPMRKTCAPFGAEAGADGVWSGPDYLAV